MTHVAALTANSETAQDIAAAFLKFQEYVADSATEITALVSELFAIIAGLLELKTAMGDQRHARRKYLVDDDTYIVLRSLEYTFKDTTRLFGGLEAPAYRTNREAYRGVWGQLNQHFRAESGNSLLTRLQYYKSFLTDLVCIVVGLVCPYLRVLCWVLYAFANRVV